ncbi:protein unc-50 [Tanacetum coccineum]
MLPTTSSSRGGRLPSRANPIFPQYLRRIIKWQQMDIEYTFWQMLHLCTSPKVVYQHTKYHKQTKNQWARDDPAFIVICILLLAVSAVAYSVAYDHSIGHTVFVVFSATCIHFLLAGAIVATFCCGFYFCNSSLNLFLKFVTNTYLREETSNSHVVEQRVEWLYAFDVHCNSFFPLYIVLYGGAESVTYSC